MGCLPVSIQDSCLAAAAIRSGSTLLSDSPCVAAAFCYQTVGPEPTWVPDPDMSAPSAIITLRPERPEDEAFLLELYRGTRREEMEATGWPAEMRDTFLQMQFKARQQGYRTTFPNGEFLVILNQGKAIGRLVVSRTREEIRLVDIALLSEQRGRGLGAALLQRLMAEAMAANLPLRLSVIRGERAARLYQRMGFARTGGSGCHDQMEWRAGQPTSSAQSAYEIQLETAAPI